MTEQYHQKQVLQHEPSFETRYTHYGYSSPEPILGSIGDARCRTQ